MTNKHNRSEQSRINGSKSKGPTTEEGKAISSMNALKHGFAAVINNVIGVEDQEAFEAHVAGFRLAFEPQNYFEETQVDKLASIEWRQSRLLGMETALLDAQMSYQKNLVEDNPKTADPDPYLRLCLAWHSLAHKAAPPASPEGPDAKEVFETAPSSFDLPCLELIRRYITTLDRQHRNTILNLRQYRKDFAPGPPPQPEPVPIAQPKEPENIAVAVTPKPEETRKTPTSTPSRIVIFPTAPPQPKGPKPKQPSEKGDPTL